MGMEVKTSAWVGFPLAVVGCTPLPPTNCPYGKTHHHSLPHHLGQRPFAVLGPGLPPLLLGIAVSLTYWLVALLDVLRGSGSSI